MKKNLSRVEGKLAGRTRTGHRDQRSANKRGRPLPLEILSSSHLGSRTEVESGKAHGGSSQVRMLPAIELWSRLKAGPLSGEKQPWMRAEGGKCFCKSSVLVCLSLAICEAFLGSSMARATHCFDSHIISSGMRMWERGSGSDFCSIPRSWHKAFTRWVKIGRALMHFFLSGSSWHRHGCQVLV